MEAVATQAPWVVLAAAAVVFPLLFFVTAPYGRHLRPGWGPTLPAKLSWVVMEAPSFFLFAAMWWLNPAHLDPTVALLAGLWLLHYGQRTFVFSPLMRGEGKRQPWLTASMAVVFNVLNASGNAYALKPVAVAWPLVLGVALFAGGMALNLHSDAVLRGLRGPGESGYKVPRGGAYRFVSSPNYLGELLEWLGFALAAGTLASWAFFAFTVANLVPRAWSHHTWYRQRFPDYPQERRALVPFTW